MKLKTALAPIVALLSVAFVASDASAYYASHMGRWLTRDPIEYRGGMNLYGYVGGMPTRFTDSMGLQYPGYPMPPGIEFPVTVTDKYCDAAKRNPKNGWLKCACEVSGDIGNAMTLLQGLNAFYDNDAKYKWFECTRNCMSKRWEEAMNNQENGDQLPDGNAWDDWCDECEANEGSQSCCEKQVEAEQNELENCMKECGSWKWGNTFPINWIEDWPAAADFNDLQDRIDFGKKECCPSQ
jgi:hypothetical protein